MADRYASLKQGLVGCWIPSISGSGLLLPDLARGNHGVLTNMDASDWVSGQYGRALDFDGTNDKVVIPNNQSFVSGTQLTASMWVKRNAIGVYYELINKFIASNLFEEDGWLLRWDNNNKVLFTVAQSGSYGQYLATTANTSVTWNHVAIVHEFGTTAKTQLFVNGQAIGASWTGGTQVPDADATNDNIVLGSQFYGGADYNLLAGQLDDIRIYNRALTEPEIKLLASEPGIGYKPAKKLSRFSQRYTYEPPPATQYGVIRQTNRDHSNLREGLVGAWCPSLAGSGLTLPDLARNNHGTLTNMGPEDWVSAQYGRALDFDSSNDFISLPNVAYLRSNQPFALSWWERVTADTNLYPARFRLISATNTFAVIRSTQSGYSTVSFGEWRGVDGVRAAGTTLSNSVGKWQHFVIVGLVGPNSNSTADYRVYENANSLTLAQSNIFSSFVGSVNQIGWDSLDNGADCLMDDIRIYNRALTEPEIRLLASRPGIGLAPERKSLLFQQQQFSPAWSRRQQLIGSGVY